MKESYKIENRFFRVELRKRKTPNEFTELHDAVENLKTEIYKALVLDKIVKWLNNIIK